MTDLIDILEQKGLKYAKTNNPSELLIQCTSGLHSDNNPSLTYNIEKNVFHCFSCGFNGGVLTFLQSIGITEKLYIESKQEYKVLKLKRKIQTLRNRDNLKLPNSASKFTLSGFNGISKNTLNEFGCFTTTELGLEGYVCIPVYQFNRLKFIDGRKRLDDDTIPKYTRKPSSIVTNDILFPIDKINKGNSVILVEGMYDMLNLWQNGIRNCLCIFGAQNFSEKKVKVLDSIGITKVSVMMDGDEAGRLATTKISSILEKNDFLVNKIFLPEDKDPGNLTADEIIYFTKQG